MDQENEAQFQFQPLSASTAAASSGGLVSEAANNKSSSSFSLKPKVPKSIVLPLPVTLTTDYVLRTCSECGKEFGSGKALGGHKRACLQKKNYGTNNVIGNQQKMKIKNVVAVDMKKLDGDIREYQTTVSTEEEQQELLHVCYVCHQGYRSLKSLYGHMRKHPEREWRGVQPPKRDNHCTSSTNVSIHQRDDDEGDDDDDDGMGSDVHLVEKIKGWSVKAKRGQRLLSDSHFSTTTVSDDEESESEAMQQAVNDLLLLAQLSPSDCPATSKKKNLRGFVNGSGYGLLKIDKKRVEEDEDEEIVKNKLKLMCDSENRTWIMKECDYEYDSETEMMMKKMKQMKKKRRLNELDDYCRVDVVNGGGRDKPVITMAAQTTYSYSCSICNKLFDKHQALGGHIASHNKNNKKNSLVASSASSSSDRNSNDSNKDIEEKDRHGQKEAAAAASEEETWESSRVAVAASAGTGAGAGSELHRCNKCDKSFPTGQALGGHKRCHYTGPAEAFSSSSQVTTSAGEVTLITPASSRTGPIHNFDLNELPTEFYQDQYHDAVEAAAAAC